MVMGRMSGFLRGLDVWLEREPDVCAEAAEELDETDEQGDDEQGDDDGEGDTLPLPAAIAH